MIDHLRRCADMTEFDAVRLQYGLHDGNSHHARVYQITGTTTDADGNIVDVRTYLPYDYVWASLPQQSAEITADPACMIVADSERYERSQDFILFVQPALVPDLMTYYIEPVRMGARYPFG